MARTAATKKFLDRLDARRATLRDEVEDDVAATRHLTPDERGKILESVCRDAMAILRARPDFDQAVRWQDPRSDESMQTWLAAVRKYRHGRH